MSTTRRKEALLMTFEHLRILELVVIAVRLYEIFRYPLL